jgi:Domain of unknown function (DUF4920)
MKTLASIFLAAFVAASAVSQDQDPKAKPAGAESRPSAESKPRRMGLAVPVLIEKDREVYGNELQFKETTKLAEVLKDPKSYAGRKVRVSGEIDSVCQKKGCWVVLKDGDARTQVTFTDYSFFVPLDVAGRKVSIEGIAKEKEIPEAMRRHYAQDAGKSKEEIEKIKGPEKTIVFVVDAIEIGPAAKADATKAESKPAEKK